MGGLEKLPYPDGMLDFVVCSAVVQHLNSFDELKVGLKEVARVLKPAGRLLLTFKAGSNDTLLTHYNHYYSTNRTFRVFDPNNVISLCEQLSLKIESEKLYMDDNWIPYCSLVCERIVS